MPVSNFDLSSLILRLHNFTDIGKRKPEQITQIFDAFKPREVSFTVASIIALCTTSRRKQLNFLIVTQRAFGESSACRYLLNRKEALFIYIGHHAMHPPSYGNYTEKIFRRTNIVYHKFNVNVNANNHENGSNHCTSLSTNLYRRRTLDCAGQLQECLVWLREGRPVRPGERPHNGTRTKHRAHPSLGSLLCSLSRVPLPLL